MVESVIILNQTLDAADNRRQQKDKNRRLSELRISSAGK